MISRGAITCAALLLWGGIAQAAATPEQACQASKVKAIGKAAKCLSALDAKAQKSGLPIDSTGEQKCKAKLASTFASSEARGDCPTTGDALDIEHQVEAIRQDLLDKLIVSGPDACAAAKLKAAGKKIACLLGLESKAASTAVPPDPARVQACKDKLPSTFAKAESKGGCSTTGDAQAIEDKVDTFVERVVADLAPIIPPPRCPVEPVCGNDICEVCEGPPGPAACAADCAQDPRSAANTCGQIYDPSPNGWVHPHGRTPAWATVGPYGPGLACCDDGYCTAEEEALEGACADCKENHCGNLLCEETTECGVGRVPSVLCSSDCSPTDCSPRVYPICGNGVCEGHWGWKEVCEVSDPASEVACPEDCGAVWIPDPNDARQTGNDLSVSAVVTPDASAPGSWTCETGLRCGDGTCDTSERYKCDQDCASSGYEVCRVDGVCERNSSGSPGRRDENGINCPADCLPSDYTCGDGACSLTEAVALVGDLPRGFEPSAACSLADLLADCNTGPSPLLLASGKPNYDALCGPNGIANKRCSSILCTRRKETYLLLHTQYNVKRSYGLGEHQGLAVTLQTVLIDARELNDGSGPRPCTPYGQIAGPLNFLQSTSLGYIYNHGRTVDTAPRILSQASLPTIEFDRRYHPSSWSSRAGLALLRCATVPVQVDGACDSVCGNDGYCLPNKALGHWDDDRSCDDFTPKHGKSQYGNSMFRGRCDLSTAWGALSFAPRVVSPRFGHNSNNDAQMTLEMFKWCPTITNKFFDNNGPVWSTAEMAAWLGGSRGGANGTDPSKGQRGLCKKWCDGDPEDMGFAELFTKAGNDKPPPNEQGKKPPCNTGGATENSRANIAKRKWFEVCNGCMDVNNKTKDVMDNEGPQPTAACRTTGGCPACGFPDGKKVSGM